MYVWKVRQELIKFTLSSWAWVDYDDQDHFKYWKFAASPIEEIFKHWCKEITIYKFPKYPQQPLLALFLIKKELVMMGEKYKVPVKLWFPVEIYYFFQNIRQTVRPGVVSHLCIILISCSAFCLNSYGGFASET